MVLKRIADNESGATSIEYAFIASLIALAIIGTLTALGNSTSTPFED